MTRKRKAGVFRFHRFQERFLADPSSWRINVDGIGLTAEIKFSREMRKLPLRDSRTHKQFLDVSLTDCPCFFFLRSYSSGESTFLGCQLRIRLRALLFCAHRHYSKVFFKNTSLHSDGNNARSHPTNIKIPRITIPETLSDRFVLKYLHGLSNSERS